MFDNNINFYKKKYNEYNEFFKEKYEISRKFSIFRH